MELPCWREFSISEIEEFKKICLGKYPTFINLTHLEDDQWAKIAEQLQVELKNVKTIFPFPLAIVTGKRSKNFHFPKTLCVQKINELPNQYFYRTKSFGLDQKINLIVFLFYVISSQRKQRQLLF